MRRRQATRPLIRPIALAPGIFASLLGAAIALSISSSISGLSGLVVALIIGIILGNLVQMPAVTRSGTSFAASKLIRAGVVALGFRLSLSEFGSIGWGGLVGVVTLVSAVIIFSQWLGRRMGVSTNLSILAGAGYAICGLSAIAAVESVIEADEAETAYAMGLVTLAGTSSIVVLPVVSSALGLSAETSGLWVGGAVHDVGQTIAAATAIGDEALRNAVVVKLARVALLAPLIAIVAWRRGAVNRQGSSRRVGVPWFILLFIVAVGLRTTGVLPSWLLGATRVLETWFFAMALFAAGLRVQIHQLRNLGNGPLRYGMTLWLIVAAFAFGGAVLGS